MRNIKFLDQLKQMDFYGYEELDIASSLYFCYKENVSLKEILCSLFRIAACLLTINIEFDIEGDGKTSFVYSNSYKGRSDHILTMHKLSNLFDSKVVFLPGKRRVYIGNVIYFLHVFKWLFSLKKYFGLREAAFYTSVLLHGITNAEYIRNFILRWKCKSVVVFSDMHIIDSILVQLCNKDGIVTATLQHGNFETDEPFVLSKSQYFLAYGEYTKKKAVLYGMDESRIKLAGMLQLLGQELPAVMKDKFVIAKKIGIILTGSTFIPTETEMINLVADYCKEKGIFLYVKFHPGNDKKDYINVNWDKIDKTFNTEITVDELREMIDVAVFLNTTVFFTYVMFLVPSLIYVDCNNNFIPEVSWCKFSTKAGLEQLINMIELRTNEFEEKLISLRPYFSDGFNVDEQYKRIINEISST